MNLATYTMKLTLTSFNTGLFTIGAASTIAWISTATNLPFAASSALYEELALRLRQK
jgi:hypothetical protein